MNEVPNFGTWSEQPSIVDLDGYQIAIDHVAPKGLNRRNFLKLAGLGALALGASACSPFREANPQPQRRNESSEVPRRYATVSDWNAGALTIEGGQGYLAYEPNSSGFSFYTIEHVLRFGPRSFEINIPNNQGYVVAQERFISEVIARRRRGDSDVCLEIPVSSEEQNELLRNFSLSPYLRMYDHPDLRRGAYLASPRYDLLEIEGRRAWTIYQVTDITRNDLYVTSYNGSLCHGRSGGPNILIEDPNYHDGKVVPILSRMGRCIVIGVSESGTDGTNYRDQYNRSCYTDLILSRPILNE